MTSTIELEILAVIILAAIACAIPGTFLVLRKNYYQADTANKSSLIGIILGFAYISQLSSLFVVLLGAITASIAIMFVNKITSFTGFREKGVSITITAAFLALGILLASKLSYIINFDFSTIYLGETSFTYFNRLRVNGVDIGSYSLYTISLVVIINIILVTIFFKEFKLDILDNLYAASIGYNSSLVDNVLIIMTSISVAISFQIAGVFMTTAFILGPAAIAYFYSKKLSAMFIVAILLCIIVSVIGFAIAWPREISLAGTIVAVLGVFFIITLFFAPEEGIVKKYFDKKHLIKELEKFVLLDFLKNNKNGNNVHLLKEYSYNLNWRIGKLNKIYKTLINEKKLDIEDNNIIITSTGHDFIENYITNRHE